ncbi:MAG: DUF4254 domain-containing protein [Nitrospinae bacterium]|jgi:hypothetical protein|nr:DUF4254 domain-containing protein [Nitrospinota bacterium]MDA1110041.1 DUF4254 domain-containing protein [Nitrospinota bacterium]
MAETLGSLVDKLSIKNLRLWHLDEALEAMSDSDSKKDELQTKRELVLKQSQELMGEINAFFADALEGKVKIRDEKVKLYTNKNVKPSDSIKELGLAVSELAMRNIRCWHLEDEVRREDLLDAEIVQLKRRIDATNQERNDLMDKVDQILANEAQQRKEVSS